MPPALVASTPPICALPSEARLKGNSRPALGRDLLSLRQRKPRFHSHGVGGEVDVAHPIEPFERDHHLVSALERDLAADEAGIAALRHDRGPRLVGELKDRGDLLGRLRA